MKIKKNRNFHCRVLWWLLPAVLLFCTGCGKEQAAQRKTDETKAGEAKTTQTDTEEQALEEITLPLMLDSDRLQLLSVFEYSGINPDCEDTYGENIGAIQLKNVSGQYLQSAQILVLLSDGQELNFLIEELPSDMEVMAFELQNLEYDDTLKIAEVRAEAQYSSEDFEKEFSYNVNGSEITVENISKKDKDNITLHYHCTIDGICFGGRAYELALEPLEAGKSCTVSDTACYLGDITVVNVNDQ